MLGDTGSTLNSGKKSEVGDKAASLGSSQRIQSSKAPKLKAWSFLFLEANSCLGSVYDEGGKTTVSAEVGDGKDESQESEVTSVGSVYATGSHPYVVISLSCYARVSPCSNIITSCRVRWCEP